MSDREKQQEDVVPQRIVREHGRLRRAVVVFAAWAVLASCIAVYSSFGASNSSPVPFDSDWKRLRDLFGCEKKKKKKNVIFMVSDGMGPASVNLARTFRQYRDDLPYDDILTLDRHFVGHSRTMSSNSFITDSAAGATAFSCGRKSYNGAISVLPNHKPCGTVLEAAKMQGYKTGLVVTTRITDATPACFSAHANDRGEEDLIAEHQIGDYRLGRMVDLMIGGGRCHYLPRSVEGGCRHDSRNLVDEAVQNGWNYVGNMAGFQSLDNGENVTLPLLGLLARTDIPFDLDRDRSVYPSLAESARTALRALEKATEESDEGFFLMIEGSRIDHAGHSNDPAAQVREVLAYDEAFRTAVEFAKQSDTETVVVSTSDHETGGVSVARQLGRHYPAYVWRPEVLLNASHSGEYLARKLRHHKAKDKKELQRFVENEVVEKGLGIYDYTDKEIDRLVRHKKGAQDAIVNMVSTRSQTGFTTHGHSAVDVNVYAFSKHGETDVLRGSNENTDVGAFIESFLNLDLDKVTQKLEGIKTTTNTHKNKRKHHIDRYFHESSL
jgi:alkaline phosphatase